MYAGGTKVGAVGDFMHSLSAAVTSNSLACQEKLVLQSTITCW